MKRKQFFPSEITALIAGLCVYYSPIVYSTIRKTITDGTLSVMEFIEIWFLPIAVILLDFCIGWICTKIYRLRDVGNEISSEKSFMENIWSIAQSQFHDGDVIGSIIRKCFDRSRAHQVYIVGHVFVFLFTMVWLNHLNDAIGAYQIPLYATIVIVVITAFRTSKLF